LPHSPARLPWVLKLRCVQQPSLRPCFHTVGSTLADVFRLVADKRYLSTGGGACAAQRICALYSWCVLSWCCVALHFKHSLASHRRMITPPPRRSSFPQPCTI
jgi:hypothetical protein